MKSCHIKNEWPRCVHRVCLSVCPRSERSVRAGDSRGVPHATGQVLQQWRPSRGSIY